MYKLHVSANSGNHQVYYRFKRKSYIWVGVLIKRSLVSIFVILMSGVVTVYSTITIVLYTVTTDNKITKIDTRDLFINTPTQIYDFLLNR